MLEQKEIDEYSRLLKACEEAKQEAQQINTEITMLKKQGMEKLQEKGYKNLPGNDCKNHAHMLYCNQSYTRRRL
mgnify:CR=1 FL=1